MLFILFACSAQPGGKTAAVGGDDSGGGPDSVGSGNPCDTVTAPEGAYVIQGSDTRVILAECVGVTVVTAGAVNQRLGVKLTDWSGPAPVVTITDVAGHLLAVPTHLDPEVSDDIQLWQSGEVFVRIEPDRSGESSGAVSVSCTAGCEREFTRYPIVMFHGFGAAGIFGGTDYFYEIRDELEARGYLVRNPDAEPFASSEDRAEDWANNLQDLMDDGLGRRFIVLAHSQGGLDARFLISSLGWGDRIVALDMIGTPNRGTVVADVLSGTITDGVVDGRIVDAASQAFSDLYGIGNGSQSLSVAMAALTTETATSFNAENPDDTRVYYRSWAGVTCGTLEPSCQAAHGGEVVEPLLEPLYLIPWTYGLPNDGMVPSDSVPWGDFRGEVNADHADEIGQMEDATNPAFDHRAFYLDEVRALAAMGF